MSWMHWPSPVTSFFILPGKNRGGCTGPVCQRLWIGTSTGIDLNHERQGLIPTSVWKRERFNEPWFPGETLSISIGQGFNLVTPLQMAVFTAAIANGGTLFRPRIVNTVKDVHGSVVTQIDPEIIGGIPAGKKHWNW